MISLTDELDAKPLEPRFRLQSSLEYLFTLLFLWGLAVMTGQFKWHGDSAILSLIVYLVVTYLPWFLGLTLVYRWFSVKKRRYWVNVASVNYYKGWFTPTLTTVPVKRIQHIEITQGSLERLFGLYSLNVKSAGEGITIPGLTQVIAQSLRERLINGIEVEDDAP